MHMFHNIRTILHSTAVNLLLEKVRRPLSKTLRYMFQSTFLSDFRKVIWYIHHILYNTPSRG